MPRLPTLQHYGFRPSQLSNERLRREYEMQLGEENEKLPPEGLITISAVGREVKTLSGGEATFTALAFITACCKVI